MKGTPTKIVAPSAGAAAAPVVSAAAAAANNAAGEKRDATFLAIQRIQREREERRRSQENLKRKRDEEMAKIEESGMPLGDADFQRMISAFRASAGAPRPHSTSSAGSGGDHICVVVRKRPINKRELANRDWDAVTCLNPRVIVHAPKLRVDGITKYLDNAAFAFDHTFDEGATTEELYRYTVQPLVTYAFERKGRGTCIAYGQTGSGKTFTITGLHKLVARDTFRLLSSPEFRDKGLSVHVSFLEIYGARCVDLLHSRNKVTILEDAKQRVVCAGLEEEEAESPDELLELIARGNSERATHATEVNSQSSRSHAICEISLRSNTGPGGALRVHGSVSLVDLAGSERAADSKNHNQQRRIESAEINKSLLALKECIRALAMKSSVESADAGSGAPHVHVPFRASKLTLVLRESFTSTQARVVMVATVSPNASSADHTGNTLRYADRVKEKVAGAAEEEYRSDDDDDDEEGAAPEDEDEGTMGVNGDDDGADDDDEHGHSLDEVAVLPPMPAPSAASGAGGAGRAPSKKVGGALPSSASALAIPSAHHQQGKKAAAAAAAAPAITASAPSLPYPRVSPVHLVEDTVDDEEDGAKGIPQPGSFVKGAADRGFSSAAGGNGALAGLKAKAVSSSSSASGSAQVVESDEDDEDGAGADENMQSAAAASAAGGGVVGHNSKGVKRPLPASSVNTAAVSGAGGKGRGTDSKEAKEADDDDDDGHGGGGESKASEDAHASAAPAASSSSLARGARSILNRLIGKPAAAPAPAPAVVPVPAPVAVPTAPAAVPVPAAASSTTPTADSSATTTATATATASKAAPGSGAISDIKSKLRDRAKSHKAAAAAAATNVASAATASSKPPVPSQQQPSGQPAQIPILIPVGRSSTGGARRASLGGKASATDDSAAGDDSRTVGEEDHDGNDNTDDDDADEPLEAVLDRGLKIGSGSGSGAAAAKKKAVVAGSGAGAGGGGGGASSHKLAQSFLPLPSSKFPPASSSSADLASVHQMKKKEDEELAAAATAAAATAAAAAAAGKKSTRQSIGGGSAPVATAAAAASGSNSSRSAGSGGEKAAPSSSRAAAAGAGGGAAGAGPVTRTSSKPAVPTQQPHQEARSSRKTTAAAPTASPPPAPSSSSSARGNAGAGAGASAGAAVQEFHETAGHLLEEEEHILQLHLQAIQQTAMELKEEGELVKATQAEDAGGNPLLEIGEYASQLEKIMVSRVTMATKLLKRLQKFKADLAREEKLSQTVTEEDLRLA